ncbi:MAG: hypothetical protein GXP45_06790 [bacterium]|nr:hypothetical protein [bacterium]
MAKKKNQYYLVRKGRETGIFDNWADCEAQVKGFQGAQYKGFVNKQEAEQSW